MSRLTLPRGIHIYLLAIFACSLTSFPAFAGVYLSTVKENGIPIPHATNIFNCSEKILGVVTGQWPAGSKHRMEAYWTDPVGKQREHTRYNFIAHQGTTHTWAWLLLHRADPDILDRLLMQEDNSLQEFIGKWKVALYIDGKVAGKLTFQVNCG